MSLQLLPCLWPSPDSSLYLSFSHPKHRYKIITRRLDYCNSLLYDNVSKDIKSVQNCLVRVVTCLLGFLILSHFWNLFTGSLFNLASLSFSALLPTIFFLLENIHIYCQWFLSFAIWKLTFSDSLIIPKFPLHLIICWWTLHCTRIIFAQPLY